VIRDSAKKIDDEFSDPFNINSSSGNRRGPFLGSGLFMRSGTQKMDLSNSIRFNEVDQGN
jgi:hypothetical protein